MTRRFDDEHATEEEMGRAPYPGVTMDSLPITPVKQPPDGSAMPPNRPVRPPND